MNFLLKEHLLNNKMNGELQDVLTCANAYGKAEYIPAAFSLQKTVRSTATTG